MKNMKILKVCVASSLLLLLLSSISQAAAVSDVSFRYGKGFRGTDFDQFDLAASMDLPWQTTFDSGWVIRSQVEGILGVLTWDGDTAVKPSVMPDLVITSPGGRVDLIAGLGCGVMIGDTEFSDDHDLGGPFFLQGQAGVRFHITKNVFAGYRYYHQSNAGIYDSNDSVNLNQVEIGWKF